jgi:hypothetical protein
MSERIREDQIRHDILHEDFTPEQLAERFMSIPALRSDNV